MNETKVTKDLESKTLIIERSFNAPKDRLWQFYAVKEKFEQWWGPEGWETTTKEFDFTPGGQVHYAMKCVDEAQGEWFGHVVEHLQLEGSPHIFQRRVTGDDDDAEVGPFG